MSTISSAPVPADRSVWPDLLVISATWGTAFLFIKLAVAGGGGMPPLILAAMRGLLAGTALGVWFVLTRRSFAPGTSGLRHMIVLGLFNGLVPNVLTAFALTRIDSAPAAMIQASTPLFVAGLAHLALSGERLTVRGVAGALIGLVGVFLLIGPSAVVGGRAQGVGALAMVGAAFSYAIATVYLRRTRPADPQAIALGQQAFAAIPANLLALTLEPLGAWMQPATTWAALVGLAVISTALPMVLYFRLLGRASASKAALVQYLLPLAAAVYGVVLLGESLSASTIAGGAVVLSGVWLASGSRGQAGRVPPTGAIGERT